MAPDTTGTIPPASVTPIALEAAVEAILHLKPVEFVTKFEAQLAEPVTRRSLRTVCTL